MVLNAPSFQLLEYFSDICLVSLKSTSNTWRKLTSWPRPDSASRGSRMWVLILPLPPSNTVILAHVTSFIWKRTPQQLIFIECLQRAKFCSHPMQCPLIVIITTLQGRCHCHAILQIRKQRPSARVYPGRASVAVLTRGLYCLFNFQTTVLLTRELNKSVHTAHSNGIHTCIRSSIQAMWTEGSLCVRHCSRS